MIYQDAVALVTGGGSGLGAQTARCFAEQGLQVAVVDLNIEGANAVAQEIGGKAYQCNVANEDQVEQVFEAVTKALGVPRILVNCAGIVDAAKVVGRDGPMSLDHFKKVIDVNLVGGFNFIRLFSNALSELPTLTESGSRGVVINTASIAAYEGQIGQAAYSASKAGMIGLTLPVARELARFGIRIVTIAPGVMETPMVAGMPDKVQESLAAMVPFPSRFGKPEEFAQLAWHITQNEMLNGCVIRLDGAIRMQPK